MKWLAAHDFEDLLSLSHVVLNVFLVSNTCIWRSASKGWWWQQWKWQRQILQQDHTGSVIRFGNLACLCKAPLAHWWHTIFLWLSNCCARQNSLQFLSYSMRSLPYYWTPPWTCSSWPMPGCTRCWAPSPSDCSRKVNWSKMKATQPSDIQVSCPWWLSKYNSVHGDHRQL